MKSNVFFALMQFAEKKGLKTFQDLNAFLEGGTQNGKK